jgi:hypothetical protein
MLDLCIFAVTKMLIVRVTKLEKVNLQTGHIVRIFDGYMAVAAPHNIVESFKNAGYRRSLMTTELSDARSPRKLGGVLLELHFPIPAKESGMITNFR